MTPLKRAKVSVDRAEVKKVIQNFAAEIMANEKNEVRFEDIKAKVQKAGGANYGVYVCVCLCVRPSLSLYL